MNESLYNKANWALISTTFGIIILVLVTMGKTDATSVNSFRFAYIVLFTILLLKAMISCSSIKIDDNDTSKFLKIIQIIFPFLPILSIIGMIIIILFKYHDKITEGKVSDYYTSFINLTSIIIIIQFIVIFKEITATNLYLSKKMASIIRLLGLLSLLSVITVHIVLKYYSTDC